MITFAICLVALAYLVGMIILIREAIHAPTGYEIPYLGFITTEGFIVAQQRSRRILFFVL